MLGQVVERGPDSAGVAVYGDPRLNPPGTSAVSLLDAGLPAAAVADAVRAALSGPGVSVGAIQADETIVVHAAVPTPVLVGAVARALPAALVIGSGEQVAVLKGIGHPNRLA